MFAPHEQSQVVYDLGGYEPTYLHADRHAFPPSLATKELADPPGKLVADTLQ